VRRIGVLMNMAQDDPESQARLAAFVQGLQQLGWTDGRNVRIDFRWAAGDIAVRGRLALRGQDLPHDCGRLVTLLLISLAGDASPPVKRRSR